MKLRTLALTAAIGLTAVAATQAQDVSGRSLKLRGANATAANIGTVTVPVLTGPRTFTFQDIDGTIALTTGSLSANRFIYTNAAGLITTTGPLLNGHLLIGNASGEPVAANLIVLRGLTFNTGAGAISLGMPTAVTTSSVLRYNGADWVESGPPFTVDASGNVTAGGTLGVSGDATFGTAASATGGALILNDDVIGTAFTSTITGPVFSVNRTITLPDASGTILLSSSGTANQLTRFGAGGTSIVDASLSDNGLGVLARAGNVAVNTGAANTLRTDGSFTVAGTTTLGDADADATTARGTINLNTTNTAGATVNINTSAFANSTNIGNTTAGDLIQMNANRAGFAIQVVNANAAGRGLTISDAVVEGLSIGSGTAPTTGITVNAATTGIVVNTGAAADLRINEALITTAGTNATISQTGDALGGSSLELQNRLGSAGALLSTTGANDVADLGFKVPGVAVPQANFRLEGQAIDKRNVSNTEGEFQLIINALPGPSTIPFYAGNGAVATTVNTTLGDGITDIVKIEGTVAGSENRLLAVAATNKFAGRVRITFAADGVGPAFTINNTQVTANSTILITVQSNTLFNYYAVVSATAAGASFNVRVAGGLVAADDLFLSYMIINP